tara:strand:+ start:178 stop:702 length:525 start_codon:yes stop_codon:yes gene_type:complete
VGDAVTANHRTLVLRAFLAVLVGAMGVLWVYAFFLAPSGNPDRVEDRAWATAAEARCAQALSEIALLPTAASAPDPATRADDLDEATAVVRAMVDDLAALSGGTEDDRDLVAHWLADWEVYVADRLSHAERLRTEGDVKPLLTALASGAGSVLERMNGFARVNDMESCLDPGDM